MVFVMDVVDAEVYHDAVGIPGQAANGVVEADAKAHITESESHEIAVV